MMLDRRRTDSYLGYIVEIINEIHIVLLSYIMMGYGFFVLQGAFLSMIGLINIVLLFTCIGINAIVLIYGTIRRIYLWCRYKFC